MRRGNTINIYGKCTGPRNQFDISDRVEIGKVEITRVNCIRPMKVDDFTACKDVTKKLSYAIRKLCMR